MNSRGLERLVEVARVSTALLAVSQRSTTSSSVPSCVDPAPRAVSRRRRHRVLAAHPAAGSSHLLGDRYTWTVCRRWMCGLQVPGANITRSCSWNLAIRGTPPAIGSRHGDERDAVRRDGTRSRLWKASGQRAVFSRAFQTPVNGPGPSSTVPVYRVGASSEPLRTGGGLLWGSVSSHSDPELTASAGAWRHRHSFAGRRCIRHRNGPQEAAVSIGDRQRRASIPLHLRRSNRRAPVAVRPRDRGSRPQDSFRSRRRELVAGAPLSLLLFAPHAGPDSCVGSVGPSRG